MRARLEQAAMSWSKDARGRRRLASLRAVCDTYVAPVSPPRWAPPLGGFWQRTASELGTERAAAGWIQSVLPTEDRDGLLQLLDLLAAIRFDTLPLVARERLLRSMRGSHDLARGFDGLRELTLGLFYGLPMSDGSNPNWAVLGYPGPPDVTPPSDRPLIRTFEPSAGAEAVELSADVCIIGSGSGGGVIAGVLASAGLDVVVLEAGGHYEEHDFPPDEIGAYQALYWRGGWTMSEDGRIKIGAGATLGGGSTINWSNCVPTPPWVRREWADQHGLKDLDTPAFDEHLAAVSQRISATTECSDANGPNSCIERGAEALGWSWDCTTRNADPTTYDPVSAGNMGYGDRSGSKQGATGTYLRDAVEHGARILVRTTAQRVVTTAGRAAGVDAVMDHDDHDIPVRVTAPTVVVAAGALETPALLLRSGIGGPAVGHNLFLHPIAAVLGLYEHDQRAWWGPPHTRISDEFAAADDGYGFLIEGLQYGAGYSAGSLPWYGARDSKMAMSAFGRTAALIALVRDRAGGRVTIGADGQSTVSYPLTDPGDQAQLLNGLAAVARLHEAAGARLISDVTIKRPLRWRRGTNLEDFIAAGRRVPYGYPDRVVGSAHQMGTARMGTDPVTSVTDPEGRLHDTDGVWVGDTSVFPTASGANPMLTCMALARRTATAILAQR